ncbi:beta-glucoside-specific PTS transporter subunit IIABC [uncultured Anaerococcus sp.]|uniref:beta-glucoside-specific PTS transporter subunit IIABC n=1 Tax=uncultured Anaerococcus sp. TaxID=293428 RepID=UPI00261C7074|nr:beta-glucoside-specific PTS transporter subunit IIABC [uncultured Anaerococcus sp.]
MKYEKLAKNIIEYVGGKENIRSVVHCSTRLRFELVDEAKANDAKVQALNEVLTLVKKSGQYQLVIGNDVDKVYQEIANNLNIKAAKDTATKDDRSLVDKVLSAITGSIAPVIPLLAGVGIGKVLLLVLSLSGILAEDSQTYIMLKFIFDTGFYFMPAFIGFSAAKRFNTNQYLGAFLGLCLVNPVWMDIVKEGEVFKFLGISVPLVKYTSSLVPALMGVWIMSYVEKYVKKIVPDMVKVFAEPLLIALIMMPLTFVVIAPIGNFISSFVAKGSMFLYDKVGMFAIAILAAVYPWLVSVGVHKALSPISITLVAEQGFDPVIRVVALCSNMSQAAASLAVSVKTKNKSLKSLAFSSSVTAFLGGITEPAMYGVNLKLKKPMYAAMIGAFVAGIFAGLVKLKAFIYVTPGILSLAMWVSKEENFFLMAILTMIIASVVTFIATLIIGFDDSDFADEENKDKEKSSIIEPKDVVLYSPCEGTVKNIEDVDDSTFSSKVMGDGLAIKPSKGLLKSPENAEVTAIFDSGHAICLKCDNGMEVLIHIGIDTVNLKGEGFKVLVEQGSKVKKGDDLIRFDIETINNAGYDDDVIIVVTNSDFYKKFEIEKNRKVNFEDVLLGVEK